MTTQHALSACTCARVSSPTADNWRCLATVRGGLWRLEGAADGGVEWRGWRGQLLVVSTVTGSCWAVGGGGWRRGLAEGAGGGGYRGRRGTAVGGGGRLLTVEGVGGAGERLKAAQVAEGSGELPVQLRSKESGRWRQRAGQGRGGQLTVAATDDYGGTHCCRPLRLLPTAAHLCKELLGQPPLPLAVPRG